MIVDQFGNRIEYNTFDEPQTAKLVQLHQIFASHPSRGLTPARVHQILEAAEQGDLTAQHELFCDMEERDGHLYSELAKRRRTVAKLNWDVLPPRNPSRAEIHATEQVKEAIQDMQDFEDLIMDLLDGIGHGFSAVELIWQRMGSVWSIATAVHRPQAWFTYDKSNRTELRLRDHSVDGLPLQPFGWIMHQHHALSGYPARAGLHRVLVWPYLFKYFALSDLAEFLDIYGLPLRIGRFPSRATQDEKATLWRAVAGIGHHAAGIIPDSMSIEFQEAGKGSEKPFESMIQWCERTQSKAITGSTLTSEAGTTGLGSGVAQVHNEVRIDIRDSDCKQLAGTLTRQLIYPWLAINQGLSDVRRCPRFVFDTLQPEDLKTYADSLPKLISVGMNIPVQWAHDKLGIPRENQNGDMLKTTHHDQTEYQTAMSNRSTQTTFSTSTSEKALIGDALLDAQLQAILTPVLQAVRSADSFEAIHAALDAAVTSMNPTPLATSLHRALFTSEWAGQGDADTDVNLNSDANGSTT